MLTFYASFVAAALYQVILATKKHIMYTMSHAQRNEDFNTVLMAEDSRRFTLL